MVAKLVPIILMWFWKIIDRIHVLQNCCKKRNYVFKVNENGFQMSKTVQEAVNCAHLTYLVPINHKCEIMWFWKLINRIPVLHKWLQE